MGTQATQPKGTEGDTVGGAEITESVMRRFDDCPEPRLREIMQAFVSTSTASSARSG